MDRITLQRLRVRAESQLGRRIADLNSYFYLDLPPGSDAVGIMDALNGLPEVELAAPVPLPAPDPSVPDFEPLQGYLFESPNGLNARFAWSIPGGTGEGVTICDMEGGWNLDHEDLPPATVLIPSGESVAVIPAEDHGTEVLGTMFSLPNGWGTTGASYGARCAVAPIYLDSGYGLFQQILWAAEHLEPGDVILVEAQTIGPFFRGDGSLVGYVPIEWDPPIYEAILTAVGNGIHVVEPAGNGSQNLDDPVYAAGNYGLAPFLPENDSGAIMVGAGIPPTAPELGPDRSRSWFSNFGSRVDVQAWGHRVVTTGASDLYSAEGPDLWYTQYFGGTSAAGPLVASAVASIEGIAEARIGLSVPPRIVRQLLTRTGMPQADGGRAARLEHIGPRPDLRSAIERMNDPIVASPRILRGFEGDTIHISVSAVDLDGDPIDALEVEGLPPGAIFHVSADRTSGDVEWPIETGQAGSHPLRFTASNTGEASDTTIVEVASAERGPQITAPGNVIGIENGPPIRVTIEARDPNDDPITEFTASSLPRGATFLADSVNIIGTLTWRPDFDQAGQYIVSFTATSASHALQGQTEVGHGYLGLTVFNADRPPVVSAPTSVDCAEGEPVAVLVSAADPDGDAILALQASPLPAGASFLVNPPNQSGTFTWTPSFDQAGTYRVAFSAANNRSGSASTSFTVANTDRPPVLDAPNLVHGVEGERLEFDSAASDPDGDTILELFGLQLPNGSELDVDLGRQQAHFSWIPRSGDAGDYEIVLIASSRPAPLEPALAESMTVHLTVESGHFAARGWVTPGQNPIRLGTGSTATGVWLAPINASFELAGVDPQTVRLTWAGGGQSDSIRAVDGGVSSLVDVDHDGVPEREFRFAKGDLRRLFAGVGGARVAVTATLRGALANGGSFEAPLHFEVKTQFRLQDAGVTPNPSRGAPVLSFYSPGSTRATLAVFDVRGRLVGEVLHGAHLEHGFHDIGLGVGRLARLRTGIYYYRLETDSGVMKGRFAVVK